MMKQDILIKVNSNNGRVELPTARLGINGENLQGNIIVDFIDEFVDGTAILEIKRNDEKYYLTMNKENSKYKLPILSSLLTEVCTIHFQIRITVGTGNDIPVWKSNIFFLKVEEAINATTTIPEEYATWIDVANEKLNEIDNLDIDVSKSGSVATVTVTKKDGTEESVEINDGIDGIDGVDGVDGITPTIGDNGNWYLGNEDTGKPSRGIQGEQGIPGNDGHTPIKGVDYFTEQDIESLNIPTKTSDLTNDSNFITNSTNNLVNYTLKTNTGSLIDLEINQTTYVVTLSLKDVDGNIISTDTIDLPLENVVVSGRYDNNTKKVILTLENGSEVDFSVADLVAGLQTEITSQNKLASDLVDDTNSGHKFVTTSEKQTWNNKANTSDIPDITGKEDKTNKVTSISSISTNTQYPSAKAVYDYIQALNGDEVNY